MITVTDWRQSTSVNKVGTTPDNHILVTSRKRSFGQGNIFTPVFILFTWVGCVSLPGGIHGCQGACVVVGGHAWLLGGMHGWGGMHGCGRCAWLLGGMYGWQGGMHGYREGICMVAGGVACMVARRHAWLPGACVVVGACVVGGMRGMWGRA